MEEHRIQFLWNAANLLNPPKTMNNLLKSYYLNITKNLAYNNLNLPKERYSSNFSCSKCSMEWYDGQYSLKLIPQKIRSTKAKKLIEKYELNSKDLTKKQKCRAKWYKKKISNFVEVICKLCKHKTKIELKKPAKVKEVSQKDIKPPLTESNKKLKSKKSKANKKTSSAGLKITPTIKQQLDQKLIKLDTNQAPSTEEPTKSPSMKIKNETKTIKSEKILHLKPMRIKPSGSKTKSNVKKPVNQKIKNLPNTSISKTQQKNKLLQLAEMLNKSSSNQQHDQLNNNRLKNLLK